MKILGETQIRKKNQVPDGIKSHLRRGIFPEFVFLHIFSFETLMQNVYILWYSIPDTIMGGLDCHQNHWIEENRSLQNANLYSAVDMTQSLSNVFEKSLSTNDWYPWKPT